MCAYLYVCMHVYICIHIHTHIHTHILKYIHIHTYRYTRAVRSLKMLLSWWDVLTDVERAGIENISKLIETSEAIIADERQVSANLANVVAAVRIQRMWLRLCEFRECGCGCQCVFYCDCEHDIGQIL